MDISSKLDEHSLLPVSLSMTMRAGEQSSSMGYVSSSEEATSQIKLENVSLEETLFNNRASLKIITSRYGASHIEPELRKNLFFQIDWLLKSEEWEENDNLPTEESFKTLIKFILNSSPVESPSLGLSDDGNLLAAWINGSNRLVLECLPYDRFNWLASCVFNGKEEKMSGASSLLERLLASLAPYSDAGWFKSEWPK